MLWIEDRVVDYSLVNTNTPLLLEQSDNVVSASGLVKRFGSHMAVDRVSVEVAGGEVHGLLGPNGAGKTTLIRLLTGLLKPDEGRISISGNSLNDNAFRTHIGYLPEERGLYPKMGVDECAMYLSRLHGLSSAEARLRLDSWYERFGLKAWRGLRIEQLSKGMQQKVQFIVAVVHRPAVVILDEPFSGCDPVNAALLRGEILTLREAGAAVLLSTHDMASVEALCDGLTLLAQGRVVAQGSVGEVRRRHARPAWEVLLREVNPPTWRLPEGITVQESRSAEGHLQVRLMGLPGKVYDDAALLRSLVGQAEVVGFNVLLPSVADIFLDLVGKKKNPD